MRCKVKEDKNKIKIVNEQNGEIIKCQIDPLDAKNLERLKSNLEDEGILNNDSTKEPAQILDLKNYLE